MAGWVECVPNISEGRRLDVVEKVSDAIRSVPGVMLLSVESDADHNRTVITIAGPGRAVLEGAFRCAAEAKKHIDLNEHTGEHPRMGATDVIPFTPLGGSTMEDCVELARELAKRIGRELEIPTYCYGDAALREGRGNLVKVRKGQFEKLKELIGTDAEREPDFGPHHIHPTAGATGVGARFWLIAYNVNLETQDVEIAKAIAKEVREKDGGLPGVKGMGFMLEEQKCAQVSMNLVDYRKTGPQKVYSVIEQKARERGVEVRESEMIGLVPRDAIDHGFKEATKCTNFTPESVIETRIESMRSAYDAPQAFLDALQSKDPTPGGGSAAAMTGAMAASLVGMVSNLTLGRKKFAEVEERMTEIRARAETVRAELQQLAREDATAFEAVLAAFKLPKESDDEKKARSKTIQEATRQATTVPLRTAELCAEICELSAEAVHIGNPNAVTDGGGAALLAEAAAKLAADNVNINVGSIKDQDFRSKTRGQLNGFLERVSHAAGRARESVAEATS